MDLFGGPYRGDDHAILRRHDRGSVLSCTTRFRRHAFSWRVDHVCGDVTHESAIAFAERYQSGVLRLYADLFSDPGAGEHDRHEKHGQSRKRVSTDPRLRNDW